MNKGRVVGFFGQVKKEVLGKFGIESIDWGIK
jgi:phenylalanyl-tRNA synthetase beta subunit